MASAMTRSTARVQPLSRWKYSYPGSVMPLSTEILSRSCWFSAFSSSSAFFALSSCSGSAGPPALAAPWRPSGCGPKAPWSAGRTAPASLDAARPPGLHALRLLFPDAGPDAALIQVLHLRLELRDDRGVLLVGSLGSSIAQSVPVEHPLQLGDISLLTGSRQVA
eukprot:4216356-Pleurochrysis_carterae.AAC.3